MVLYALAKVDTDATHNDLFLFIFGNDTNIIPNIKWNWISKIFFQSTVM